MAPETMPQAAQDPDASSPSLARQLALHGCIALLWLLAWGVAKLQEQAPHASLWFPPSGLTFAVGLTLGWRGLPGVVLGGLLATLLDALGDPARSVASELAPGLAFGLTHGCSYILGARLLTRLGQDRPSLRFVSVLLLATPLAATLATASGLLALTAFGVIGSLQAAREIVLPFWIGDLVGTVALGPFFMMLLTPLMDLLGVPGPDPLAAHRQVAPAEVDRDALFLKVALCLVPVALSAGLVAVWPQQAHPASFLVFFAIVPLMWIAHTEGALRTYAATASLSMVLSGVGAVLGPGPHAVTFQFAMIILSGSAYFGLIVPLLYADNRDLRRLLTHDALTGAATRALFLETAEREVERARRFGTPLALVLYDLDRFKLVNDELGHSFGDAALSETAERCRGELRASDLLGRLGGEEFAVLLPMTGLAAACETAERLAEVLRCRPVLRQGQRRTVTASFGVAEIEVQHEDFTAAFERADEALYAAKAAGRDRVALGREPGLARASPVPAR